MEIAAASSRDAHGPRERRLRKLRSLAQTSASPVRFANAPPQGGHRAPVHRCGPEPAERQLIRSWRSLASSSTPICCEICWERSITDSFRRTLDEDAQASIG